MSLYYTSRNRSSLILAVYISLLLAPLSPYQTKDPAKSALSVVDKPNLLTLKAGDLAVRAIALSQLRPLSNAFLIHQELD